MEMTGDLFGMGQTVHGIFFTSKFTEFGLAPNPPYHRMSVAIFLRFCSFFRQDGGGSVRGRHQSKFLHPVDQGLPADV